MSEFDSRYIAFENDHTYLKTTFGDEDDKNRIQLTPAEPKNDGPIVFDTVLTDDQQNMVDTDLAIPNMVHSLDVPHSNVLFIADPLNFPLSSNIQISPSNLPITNVSLGNKSSVRPIQPKITNTIPVTQTPLNVFHNPSKNTALSTQLKNMNSEKTSTKFKTPILVQERPVVKHIKPVKNKIIKDYANGICTIKLSSSLLKRIQNGEKLFMCMECDKTYTQHKDLLDHQIIHNKHNQYIVEEKHERENVSFTNKQNKKVFEYENIINDDYCTTKQTKTILTSSVNSKKRKVIFQGECIMCHSVFQDLGKHIRTFHKSSMNKNIVHDLNYHCNKCDMDFDIKQQLRAHELSAHKSNCTYKCEHCFKDFTYRKDLEKHIETHYGDSMKYLCPYCDTGFPHSNGLRTHLVKHIGFSSPENMAIEIPANHKIEYSPSRPPEQLDELFAELDNISDDTSRVYIEHDDEDNYRVIFSKDDNSTSLALDPLIDKDSKSDLELNKDSMENSKIIINQQQTSLIKKRISYTVCRICMIIVSYSRIGRHMKKRHNNAAPYQCEICHAEFNRKHIMDDHRRKHTNNKPHKCIECARCFTYKHHLNRHMMLLHNADALIKPFKCSVCDKAFSFKEYLTLHVNSRHKGKHYMCQVCGKSFSTNAALNKHQLCHTDERPYMCEHCGRTFKCKTHCDTHKKNMHPGDPNLTLPPEKYECSLCYKKFSTKVYRDMHFKRHNGQGHQCDICYKLFVSKAHMQRHIKIMHQT